MKVWVILLFPALIFSFSLINTDSFFNSTSFDVWNGNGFSVVTDDNGLGFGYSFKTDNTIYSVIKRGLIKLRLRTGWERFDFQLIYKRGVEILALYNLRDFSLGFSRIFRAFRVGETGIFKMEDSFSSTEIFGFGLMSRKFCIEGGSSSFDLSLNAFKYLDLSLGASSMNGKRLVGFFIPTKRFSDGFLMGFWWEDGIAFGSSGRLSRDLGRTDLEFFWGLYMKGEYFKANIILSLEIGRNSVSLLLGTDGLGVIVHE